MKTPWSSAWSHVWVIGGSTGIGRETVEQLAKAGIRVTASARSEEALADLSDSFDSVSALPLDVTDPEACKAAVASFDTPPDLILYMAAVYAPMGARNYSAETARWMMRINYEGVCNILDPLLPVLFEAKAGHIALVASISGYFGLPMAAGYSPSKAAIHNLAESIKPELDQKGVALSVVNPGFVRTRLTDKNKFQMPQILEVDDAVNRMLSGLAKKKFEVIFPHPFASIIKGLRLLPRSWVFNYTRTLVRK